SLVSRQPGLLLSFQKYFRGVRGADGPPRPRPGSPVAIGAPRTVHRGVVVAEDLHHPRLGLGLVGNLLPELARRALDLGPFGIGDRGELELLALDPEPRLAGPVPVLAVVVRLLKTGGHEVL